MDLLVDVFHKLFWNIRNVDLHTFFLFISKNGPYYLIIINYQFDQNTGCTFYLSAAASAVKLEMIQVAKLSFAA